MYAVYTCTSDSVHTHKTQQTKKMQLCTQTKQQVHQKWSFC